MKTIRLPLAVVCPFKIKITSWGVAKIISVKSGKISETMKTFIWRVLCADDMKIFDLFPLQKELLKLILIYYIFIHLHLQIYIYHDIHTHTHKHRQKQWHVRKGISIHKMQFGYKHFIFQCVSVIGDIEFNLMLRLGNVLPYMIRPLQQHMAHFDNWHVLGFYYEIKLYFISGFMLPILTLTSGVICMHGWIHRLYIKRLDMGNVLFLLTICKWNYSVRLCPLSV